MNTHKLLLLAAVAALALAACPKQLGNNTGVIVDKNALVTCDTSEKCTAGQICSAGFCVAGTCDPAFESACDGGTVSDTDKVYCCKPWELCDPGLLSCKNDPNVHGIGCDPTDTSCTPCEVAKDCAAGQFCSGAVCYDSAGRDSCTSTFQCPAGQRCDQNQFLCVPDLGGCKFCGPDFPELCCEATQTCSTQSGFCTDVPPPQCSTPGEQDTCDAGLKCDALFRCVQCVTTADCGPGTECDEGTGDCFPTGGTCPNGDSDCSGDLRCNLSNHQCVSPQCLTDSDCTSLTGDHRQQCDLGSFTCFLPPPVCDDEPDEPNNSTSDATPMAEIGGEQTYTGLLCRLDTDVLSFPIHSNKHYTATVNFGTHGEQGVSVQLLNNSEQIESSAVFDEAHAQLQLSGQSGVSETGVFYVKVFGTSTQQDSWGYSVTVDEADPSPPADCSPAGQAEEPNDDFDHATQLTLGATTVFSRCGVGDKDFYKVTLPPLQSITVSIQEFFNPDGNLDLTVFTQPDTAHALAGGSTQNPIELVNGPEGPVTYYMKVALASTSGALTNQTYSITTTGVDRPAACAADINENDGIIAGAVPLVLVPDAQANPSYVLAEGKNPDGTDNAAVHGPLRCNAQDIDLYKFTMPQNLGGFVVMRFNQSLGDMALDLLDATGTTVLTTSNVSTAGNPTEQVSVPSSATANIDYVVRARLAGTSGGTLGQPYSLEVHTFDNTQCAESEPSGGDDTFQSGRCISNFTPISNTGATPPGTFAGFPCVNSTSGDTEPLEVTLADCVGQPGTVDGCGLICGNGDTDWYRVGILDTDQELHAHLEYDASQGVLALARGTLAPNGTFATEVTASDTGAQGHVDLFFTAPAHTATSAKEYGVRVKTVGTTGHQVQPYALSLEVGLPCTDDFYDALTKSNEKPSQATILRENPTEGAPFTYNSASDANLGGGSLSHCVSGATVDVDVYELFAFAGEQVTVTLTPTDSSPGGLVAELGTRPDNLDDPAVSFAPALTTAD
ncbi:MAG TPA: hypothetical protein VGO62_14090, partial [Myxococcota bacterium]